MSHRRSALLPTRSSLFLSFPPRLTGATKVFVPLLRTKAIAVHAGPSPPPLQLNHTLPSQLECSLTCLPNRSPPVLLTLTIAEAQATAMAQLLSLLSTTLLTAKVCLRNSSTPTRHTTASKALAQCHRACPRSSSQASFS